MRNATSLVLGWGRQTVQTVHKMCSADMNTVYICGYLFATVLVAAGWRYPVDEIMTFSASAKHLMIAQKRVGNVQLPNKLITNVKRITTNHDAFCHSFGINLCSEDTLIDSFYEKSNDLTRID